MEIVLFFNTIALIFFAASIGISLSTGKPQGELLGIGWVFWFVAIGAYIFA